MKSMLLGVAFVALISLGFNTVAPQTNQQIAQAAQANVPTLKQYQWKSRTEVQKDGETKNVQVVLMSYDGNGQIRKTPLSGTAEPDLPKFGLRKVIAQKKYKAFKETVQELGALARSYSELPPEMMQRFMATASLTPEITTQQKLVRVEGRNVLQSGDSMTVWLDAISRKQRRVEIQTSLNQRSVRIVSEFEDIPQRGPTYTTRSRVNYDDASVVIITENFDHARVQ